MYPVCELLLVIVISFCFIIDLMFFSSDLDLSGSGSHCQTYFSSTANVDALNETLQSALYLLQANHSAVIS